MIQRFRTKVVEVEAVQFLGDNVCEIATWTKGYFRDADPFVRADNPEIVAEVYDDLHKTWIGVLNGQWIVRGAKGEFYPCDNETFHWKYEEVGPYDVEYGSKLASKRAAQ